MAYYTNEEIPYNVQKSLEKEQKRTEQGQQEKKKKKPWYKRKLFWTLIVILIIIGIVVYFLIRAGILLNNISTSDRSFFGQLLDIVRDGELKGINEDRINVAIFGMRGKDKHGNSLPGGSLLTDTNMVISIKPDSKKVAMISIPRDLYIEIPKHNYQSKINSAYSIGEQEQKGRGIILAKDVMEEATGLPIHYTIAADFYAFKEVIDALDGIEITLDKPFSEPTQFEGEGESDFYLPSGTHTMDGETALFYARARYASSDFDRSRRQQQILEAVKDKALETGAVNSPSTVRKFLKALEGNIKTDMTLSEMESFMNLLQDTPDQEIIKVGFDTSGEGLLESSRNSEGSYILTPVGGSFSKIHETCKNIFETKSIDE